MAAIRASEVRAASAEIRLSGEKIIRNFCYLNNQMHENEIEVLARQRPGGHTSTVRLWEMFDIPTILENEQLRFLQIVHLVSLVTVGVLFGF